MFDELCLYEQMGKMVEQIKKVYQSHTNLKEKEINVLIQGVIDDQFDQVFRSVIEQLDTIVPYI